MHVLQLLPSLTVGGVERGVLDLAKGLMARGHQISVVSSGGPLVEPLLKLGAAHHTLSVHEKAVDSVASCVPAVAKIIRTTGVDLVHARSRVPAWIGWLAARQAQKPFLTTAHGFYHPHFLSRVMVWGRLVIVPSESLGHYLAEHFGVPKDRLRVIPRGVDLDDFSFQPSVEQSVSHEPWRIGLFGRLSAIKGHAVAVRACERLLRRQIAVKLSIVGDAPQAAEKSALDQLIKHLKMQDAVEYLGVRQDIPPLIASMDVVIVPSVYPESFGRGVIEAQAVGRPVVASRLGALTELIEDGKNGLLVSPNDPAALASAIERFISDPSLRSRCILAGRRQVESKCTLTHMVEQTLAVYEECLHKPRVVVWKLSALGDVILSTPSLRALRKHYPKAHITLVVGRAAYEAVARCPYLDDIIIYDPARKDRGLIRHWRFIRKLRRYGFDMSVDLQNSRRTHLFAYLSGAWLRMGFRRKWGTLLNAGIRLPKVILAPIAHQQYLFRESALTTDGEKLELWPSVQDEKIADQLLGLQADNPVASARLWVGIHPGGSGRWKTKRWDLARWAKVCDAFSRQGVRVVVVGGPEEELLGQELVKLTATPPLMLIGKTRLLELACVIKRCAVFLAHDSSSLHVAAACGTPTVALFGPTDPRRHLPPNFSGLVIRKDVFCSPCYATRCRTITHACMRKITVEEVLNAAQSLMAEKESVLK